MVCLRADAAYAAQRVVWLSFYLYVSLLVLAVQVSLFYVFTVVAYDRERQYEMEHSWLGRTGRRLASNPNYVEGTLMAIFVLTIISRILLLLPMITDFVYLFFLPPMILVFLGFCAPIASASFTVKGRAQRRSKRIVENLQRRGHQQWLVERYLAELIQNRDCTDGFRSRVAAKALEMLMERNDWTGKIVRELMADSDRFVQKHSGHGIPSRFWDFGITFVLMESAIVMGILFVAPREFLGDIWFTSMCFMLLYSAVCCWWSQDTV